MKRMVLLNTALKLSRRLGTLVETRYNFLALCIIVDINRYCPLYYVLFPTTVTTSPQQKTKDGLRVVPWLATKTKDTHT